MTFNQQVFQEMIEDLYLKEISSSSFGAYTNLCHHFFFFLQSYKGFEQIWFDWQN